MMSNLLKTRFGYIAISAFLVWHTIALALGPVSENNATAQALRQIYKPYLTLLRLDNAWEFFAPNVGKWSQLRYVVEDSAGNRHTFVPANELNWFYPTYTWFRDWYVAIMDDPDIYGDSAASLLCRKHAALHPVAITFIRVDEEAFWPEDHLKGQHPLDDDHVSITTLNRFPCPTL